MIRGSIAPFMGNVLEMVNNPEVKKVILKKDRFTNPPPPQLCPHCGHPLVIWADGKWGERRWCTMCREEK